MPRELGEPQDTFTKRPALNVQLLVFDEEQVLVAEPLVLFLPCFALAQFGVAPDEGDHQVISLIGVKVAVNIEGLVYALHLLHVGFVTR